MSTSPQEVLVYGGSVYVHRYDTNTQAYCPLNDSAVGLALMGLDQKYRLFCYNRSQEEILSIPLDLSMKFIPQQDHYVNFYDSKGQNYSMRFKDDTQVNGFLQAIACIKLYFCRGSNHNAMHNDIQVGEGYAVQVGDIVGIKIQAWNLDSFVNGNPIDLIQTTAILSALNPDDLHKVKLGDTSTEGIVGLSEEIIGMQKGGMRYVFLPMTSSWVLAHVELLKIKKEKRGSASPSNPTLSVPMVSNSSTASDDHDAERREELLSRMAHLSRMGSGQVANTLLLPSNTSSSASLSRKSSQQDVLSENTTVPIRVQTPIALTLPTAITATSSPGSVPSIVKPSASQNHQVESLRKEQESLLQEQQEIARLRRELEEARQKTLEAPKVVEKTQPTSSPPSTPSILHSLTSMQGESFRSSLTPYGGFQQPPTTPPFAPYSSQSMNYSITPPVSFLPPQAAPVAAAGLSSEADATLQRVQRTTLSMEGMLIEMQRKMDRLLTQQAPPASSSYSSYNSRRHESIGGGSNSLLKNVERALAESDTLQEENSRLTHQIQELQRYNRQLQDDVDRLHYETQRNADRSSMYAAGEVQSLQLALDNAKKRCAQMESDVQRWTAALEKERTLRAQVEQDFAAAQRVVTQQTQAQQASQAQNAQEYERKIEEARNIAILAQKKLAEEKEGWTLQVNQLTLEIQQHQNQLQQQSTWKNEIDKMQTQILMERESHNRDAEEAKMHLEELVKDMTTNRTKLATAERNAMEMERYWKEEQERSKQARENQSEIFKELMNDIYFACQDTFDEDAEYTGKEVAIQIRKILKQQTNDILAKLS